MECRLQGLGVLSAGDGELGVQVTKGQERVEFYIGFTASPHGRAWPPEQSSEGLGLTTLTTRDICDKGSSPKQTERECRLVVCAESLG